VADGFGIKLAFLRFGKFLKYRFAGVDLMMEILRLANDRGLEIFLAINKDGLSNFSEIKTEILKIFPNLKIFGDDINVSNIQYSILDIRYQILLCNFGAPQQEIFINNLKSDTIRIAMGIGGSFDFLTGKIKRAPKIFRILGLEWLYRFIQEPKYRWKRIFNAVIIFPVKIILN
jgi:N-acetylglucosaminyldiphosphoundecaprenol N-acetyl-beta-D-mannosaminyltransferase